MQIEIYFEKTIEVIINELQKAEVSIIALIDTYTHLNILNKIVERAKSSINIKLLYSISSSNENIFDFTKINKIPTGNIYSYEEGTKLIHQRFYVIDNQTLITINYNTSSHIESITVTKGSFHLISQFNEQFNNLLALSNEFSNKINKQNVSDIGKLTKRLKLIKNFILLEEHDDIISQLNKLKIYTFNTKVAQIIEELSSKKYSQAIKIIDSFINEYHQVTIYEDAELSPLRLEIRVIELELKALNNQKADIEKTIHDFEVLHNRYLGEIIKKILKLRKEKLAKEIQNNTKKEVEYEEAKRDFDNYHKHFQDLKEEVLYKLDDIQHKKLKKNFRKAALLCHPDNVSNEMKIQAEQIFIELKLAYSQNDLDRVNDILETLQNEKPFISHSERYTEKAKLKAEIQRIRLKVKSLKKEIVSIKNTNPYKTIQSIKDWDIYFEESKTTLQKELKNYE